jgi:hypothetical protein
VLESHGMTEASRQMASSLLPAASAAVTQGILPG